MPIFVSRFSAERIAASGLQRATQRQPESRATTQRNRVDRLDESERERAAQRSERAQDQLPVTTQTAESIRQGSQSSRAGSDQRSEDSRSGQQGNSAGQETARPKLPTQATLPGVSTVSTRAERSASPQVGRLNQARGESRAQPTLSRFEGLRSASPATPGNTRSAAVRQSFRDIPSNADSFSGLRAQRLDAQVDASIRLLRSNGNASERVQQPVAEPETTSVTAQPETRPNAEQISRANTTPEIQNNLRQDSSEIERGLRVDAEIQSQENLRQTARTAERTAETRRESTANANDRQVRELSIQERQLEQGLRATQSEIRSLNNESNQAQSSASSATSSTASNLANRTSLIS